MDALISIQMADGQQVYRPGEMLQFEFQIDAIEADNIQALECSVMWFTEGKGDEDLGVHYFERLVPGEDAGEDLRPLRLVETTLPNSPLSYTGEIICIRWCIRVRVFPRQGREVVEQLPFRVCCESSS